MSFDWLKLIVLSLSLFKSKRMPSVCLFLLLEAKEKRALFSTATDCWAKQTSALRLHQSSTSREKISMPVESVSSPDIGRERIIYSIRCQWLTDVRFLSERERETSDLNINCSARFIPSEKEHFFHGEENVLECQAKVFVQNGVEDRIDRGIGVTQPDEEFNGVETQTETHGTNDVQSEERQPTADETTDDDGQGTCDTRFGGDFAATELLLRRGQLLGRQGEAVRALFPSQELLGCVLSTSLHRRETTSSGRRSLFEMNRSFFFFGENRFSVTFQSG